MVLVDPELTRIDHEFRRQAEARRGGARLRFEPARLEHSPEWKNAHSGLSGRKPAHQVGTGVLTADDDVRCLVDNTLKAAIAIGSHRVREELRAPLVLEVWNPSDPGHREWSARWRLEGKQHVETDAPRLGFEAARQTPRPHTAPQDAGQRILRSMCVDVDRHIDRQTLCVTGWIVGSGEVTEVRPAAIHRAHRPNDILEVDDTANPVRPSLGNQPHVELTAGCRHRAHGR